MDWIDWNRVLKVGKRGVWEDLGEAGDIEPPISDESSSPVGVASAPCPPPPLEVINPALPEETPKASTGAVSMQDNAESPPDLPLPLLFASRSVTRHPSQ